MVRVSWGEVVLVLQQTRCWWRFQLPANNWNCGNKLCGRRWTTAQHGVWVMHKEGQNRGKITTATTINMEIGGKLDETANGDKWRQHPVMEMSKEEEVASSIAGGLFTLSLTGSFISFSPNNCLARIMRLSPPPPTYIPLFNCLNCKDQMKKKLINEKEMKRTIGQFIYLFTPLWKNLLMKIIEETLLKLVANCEDKWREGKRQETRCLTNNWKRCRQIEENGDRLQQMTWASSKMVQLVLKNGGKLNNLNFFLSLSIFLYLSLAFSHLYFLVILIRKKI